MASEVPIVLTIAGFDPSSGAGVTADIKTIAAHECYGIAAITALTVQSTRGVRRVEPVSPDILKATLEELVSDVEVAAVRIGMLGSGKLVKILTDFLAAKLLPNVVLDPILKSTSGADLLDRDGKSILRNNLLPLANVITPNAEEASELTGLPVVDLAQMREAATKLHGMGAKAVVVTGGHLEKATELLSVAGKQGTEQEVFRSDRLPSRSTHGTGCAFATAIACHLALGRGLPEAVLLAKAYVSAAITNAQPIGKGTGPLHHLYRMGQQRRAAAAKAES